jgi:hypothetical protein
MFDYEKYFTRNCTWNIVRISSSLHISNWVVGKQRRLPEWQSSHRCTWRGWHPEGGLYMSTQFEQLFNNSEKSESTSGITGNVSLPNLVDIELHQLRNVLDSYSKATLPDAFPSLGFEHKPKDVDRPHTGNTDAAKQASRSLYGEFSNPLEAIKPDACVQPYGIGSCYFVAALTSLAKAHPEQIKDMIRVNDDGSFTVKFPGASKPVTVDKPTDAEIEKDGGATKYGTWSLILQKAYGKYCGGGKETDLQGADGGSMFSAGIRILSDKGVPYGGIGNMLELMSWKDMDKTLQDAVSPANRSDAIPVVASTSKSIFGGDTKDGFVRGHVYSVLDYKHNPDDIKQSKVTVRNPWGGNDAVREITLQQFYDNFIQLSYPKR